jgi:hypothetical protein
MLRMTVLLMTTALTMGAATKTALAEDPSLPRFDASAFAAPKANPWFPVTVGSQAVIVAKDSETSNDETNDDEADEEAAGAAETADNEADDDSAGGEVTRSIVTGPGPVLMGVATTQILDEEWVDGRLMERAFDLVANDAVGNVWYFGEEVTNFTYAPDGSVTGRSTETSWRAGEAGALPGILVPGAPEVGQASFVAQAPAAQEMDYWEVISTDDMVAGPAGSFSGVLKLRHGSPLEPDDRELAYYAPGVGLVREEAGLSPALDKPEVVGERQP